MSLKVRTLNEDHCPGVDDRAGSENRLQSAALAWLESALRNFRGAEPAARDRQMAASSIMLLSVEALGALGLAPTAPARCERARCLADSEIGSRAVAAVAYPGAVAGLAGKVLCALGTTEPGGAVAMFIEPPWYVICMPGGVGGEAP